MKHFRTFSLHGLIGAMMGIVVLHPLTKAVYWFEFRDSLVTNADSLWTFFLHRFESAFAFEMLPMTFAFALIGACIGLAFAFYHLTLLQQHQTILNLEHELSEDLSSLIRAGESERLEFKSSVRWDFRQQRANKVLEVVIAKSIAGFMNHKGGTLLVGVSDAGEVLGLQDDYKTLKHKNRDGFELFINDLVESRLSGELCTLVHCSFHVIDNKDVARVFIEPAGVPVIFRMARWLSIFYVQAMEPVSWMRVKHMPILCGIKRYHHVYSLWSRHYKPDSSGEVICAPGCSESGGYRCKTSHQG